MNSKYCSRVLITEQLLITEHYGSFYAATVKQAQSALETYNENLNISIIMAPSTVLKVAWRTFGLYKASPLNLQEPSMMWTLGQEKNWWIFNKSQDECNIQHDML